MAPEMQGGAKIGTRIATLVSQSMIYTHSRLMHLRHKLAMRIFSDISDIISEEVHGSTGSIIRELHAGLPDDSIANPLMRFMATESGQLQALAGTFASASGLFSSVAEVVNNELAPSVRGILESNPHQLPDPGTIAMLAAHGLAEPNDAVSNINQQGINSGWANALIKLNEQFPDSGTMLDLVRRGAIGRDTFIEWSARSGMSGGTSEAVLSLLNVPLSPADSALAVLRGNIDQADGEKHAAAYGIDAPTFQTLIDNTGEPLGLMELLEAYRRGFIDKPRLERGIIQSRVRNEWLDVAEALRFSPMSVADAVNSVIQGHITADQGNQISEQNGLEPGAFDVLVQTAGEPLSRTELEELFNRGLITEDQVKQGLLESRLKNKYTEYAFALHTKLLPIRNLSEAVEYGTLPLADAVREAMKGGYSQADATALIQTASARKLHQYRTQIVTAAETLFIDGALDAAGFLAVAQSVGFDAVEAQAIAEGASYKQTARLTSSAIDAIRSKYIARHVTSDEVSGLLDGLGIIAAYRDKLIQVWTLEQSSATRLLTPAEIVKAVKMEIITSDEGTSRLIALGYSADDAALRLAIG